MRCTPKLHHLWFNNTHTNTDHALSMFWLLTVIPFIGNYASGKIWWMWHINRVSFDQNDLLTAISPEWCWIEVHECWPPCYWFLSQMELTILLSQSSCWSGQLFWHSGYIAIQGYSLYDRIRTGQGNWSQHNEALLFVPGFILYYNPFTH